EHRDDPARRIAVQRRKRAAKDFHPTSGFEHEVGDLTLAVGHGRRDAVAVQAHAADAEARAGPEAADRYLQPLRLVLAVARNHARYALQGLGQAQPGPCAM